MPFRPSKVACVLTVAAAAGCTPIVRDHGYVPPEDLLAEVQVGQDTRDSVADKIGRPLHAGLGGSAAWYYIASTRETVGLFAPNVVERDIVAIRFTDAGAVENIERFDVSDGQVVRLTARVTDSSVSELGLLRQIFGNIGVPQIDDLPDS